jgi:hypothetical protein
MFHTDWLIQLFPRSKKAVQVFIIMLLALGTLSTTAASFRAPHPPLRDMVLFFVSFAIGMPASAYYYFLQSKPKAGYSEIDTLDHYYKNEVAKSQVAVISTSQPAEPLKKQEK